MTMALTREQCCDERGRIWWYDDDMGWRYRPCPEHHPRHPQEGN